MTVKIDHVIPATDKYGKKYTKRDLTLLKSARHKQDKCMETRAKYAALLKKFSDNEKRVSQVLGDFKDTWPKKMARERLDSLTPIGNRRAWRE